MGRQRHDFRALSILWRKSFTSCRKTDRWGSFLPPRERFFFTSQLKTERFLLLKSEPGIENSGGKQAGIRQKKLPEGLKE